jgi:WbqC-like protein family
MKVVINQPTYLPWIGYFDLIDQADRFILLDCVQFEKRSWQQRNRIKLRGGLQWLTVPAKTQGRLTQLIREVEISDPKFWSDHTRAIELAYRRTPYFERYFPPLTRLLEANGGALLLDLNFALIQWICAELQIRTPILTASSLGQSGKRTELLANLCASQGATEYLSPAGSAAYLVAEEETMRQRGTQIVFHHYEHPVYRQNFPPFEPFASVIDLLFNEGPRSYEILRSGRKECLSPAQICALAASPN